MFHVLLSELAIDLKLTVAGPLLIKEGVQPDDVNADSPPNEMKFVRAQLAGSLETIFYLPGAGIKGALRNAAERRTRAQDGPHSARSRCCDPFNDASSCGKRAIKQADKSERPPSGAAIYAAACPICRCFGHHRLAGRWSISDALPLLLADYDREGLLRQQAALKKQHQVRNSVGISRRTGGSEKHLLYSYETLTGGDFFARLTLVNYELWQLGLLAYLLDDLNSGVIRLGYGTRRGLGRVRLEPLALRWRFPTRPPSTDGDYLLLAPLATAPLPAGCAAKDESTDGYAIQDGAVSCRVGPVERSGDGPLESWVLHKDQPAFAAAVEQMWADAAPRWWNALANWPEVPRDV